MTSGLKVMVSLSEKDSVSVSDSATKVVKSKKECLEPLKIVTLLIKINKRTTLSKPKNSRLNRERIKDVDAQEVKLAEDKKVIIKMSSGQESPVLRMKIPSEFARKHSKGLAEDEIKADGARLR